jgi:hypothetical protein
LVVLSGQKGVFWPFFGSKIKTQLSNIFDGIFLQELIKLFFWGTQKQFLAVTDERFSNLGRSKRPKRSILADFWVKN